MRNRLIPILTFALLGLVSCKSQYALLLEGNDVPAKYAKAMELFDARKYGRAAEMFESLSPLTRGLPQDDTVQFYWGLSNYRYKDYLSAEGNLEQFITTFPMSPFTEEAKYLRLNCLYQSTYRYELDPVPTLRARSAIQEFKAENPGSKFNPELDTMLDDLNNRLELKAYKAAHLYYHMEDYIAAHYALKNVLKENAENRYREEILYYTAMSAYKYADRSVPAKQKERFLTFVDDYFNLVSEYPETRYRKEVDDLYARAQDFIRRQNEQNEKQETASNTSD